MKSRPSALVALPVVCLVAFSGCAKVAPDGSSAASSSSSSAGGDVSSPTSGTPSPSLTPAANPGAGRKKAATAKLPGSIAGMSGVVQASDGGATVTYQTPPDATKSDVAMVTVSAFLMGDPTKGIKDPQTYGDSRCGTLEDSSPVCVVLLDGGHMLVNGAPTTTPEQLSKLSNALYAQFA